MPKVIKPDGIPAARARLDRIIARVQLDGSYRRGELIQDLIAVQAMMFRKPPIRMARVKARPITEDIKRQVHTLAAKHPNMHMQEIGDMVGINAGRVSEILNGLR